MSRERPTTKGEKKKKDTEGKKDRKRKKEIHGETKRGGGKGGQETFLEKKKIAVPGPDSPCRRNRG